MSTSSWRDERTDPRSMRYVQTEEYAPPAPHNTFPDAESSRRADRYRAEYMHRLLAERERFARGDAS